MSYAAQTMTEAQLQEAVIETAHLFNWRVHHVKPARTPDGQYLTRIQGDRGFPDLVLARDGRIIFAELKSASGRLRPDQKDWLYHLEVRFSRVLVVVWRPDDWVSGEIREALR